MGHFLILIKKLQEINPKGTFLVRKKTEQEDKEEYCLSIIDDVATGKNSL